MQADESLTLSSHYLKNLISIVSQLLQTGVESSSPEAVEATWVLSLALKGLYSILKVILAYCLICAVVTKAGVPGCDFTLNVITMTVRMMLFLNEKSRF